MNYKIGDKVKIIRNTSGSNNKIGDIGTIKEVSNWNVKVLVPNTLDSVNYHVEEDLELVESAIEPLDLLEYIHKYVNIIEGDFFINNQLKTSEEILQLYQNSLL